MDQKATSTTLLIVQLLNNANSPDDKSGLFAKYKIMSYKSVIGLYFGTSTFITIQAIRYATAQKINAMA